MPVTDTQDDLTNALLLLEDEIVKRESDIRQSARVTTDIGSSPFKMDRPGHYMGGDTDIMSRIAELEVGVSPEDAYEGSLASTIGKTIWAFGEVATFGVTDLLFPETAKALAPVSKTERIFATLGGVAGFALPMSGVKSVLGYGVRNVSKYGSKKVAQSFSDDAVKFLRGDKEFVKWAEKEGVSVEVLARKIAEPVSKDISSIGRRKGLSSLAGKTGKDVATNLDIRKQFTKNLLDKKTGLRGIIQDNARRKGFKIDEKTLTNMESKLGMYLGEVEAKGFKNWENFPGFPLTTLQERMSFMFGGSGGKVAQVAAAAVEEAILFSAVELPLSYAQMYAHYDMSFGEWWDSPFPGKALAHAFVLGSALGLIRYIPGGGEKGIITAALGLRHGRIARHLRARKRYSSYDPSVREHRLLLVNEGKRILTQREDMLKTLRNTTRDANIKGNISLDNLEKMIEGTAKEATHGAKQIQNWLVDIESAFYKQWWPDFVKGAMGDIYGSKWRMLAGSLAFNFTTLFGADAPSESWDEKIFHIALGAVLTRKHHPLKYYSKTANYDPVTNTHKPGWAQSDLNRPYIYGDRFSRADEYLNIMGTSPASNAFMDLVNMMRTIRAGVKTPIDHPDMAAIVGTSKKPGLLRELDLIVERTTETGVDPTGLQYNEVYDMLRTYVENKGLIDASSERMLSTSEISADLLSKVLSGLSKLDLKGIEESSINKASGGIDTISDIETVFVNSDKDSYFKLMGIEEKAIISAYDRIVEMATGKNPMVTTLKESSEMPVLKQLLLPGDSHTGLDYYRIQNFMQRYEAYDGVLWEIDRSEAQKLVLTKEMLLELVGEEQAGNGGILGEPSRQIHEYVTDKDPYYAERFDQYGIIGVGHPVISDFISKSAMFESVDRAWKMMQTMENNNLGLWKNVSDESVSNIKQVKPSQGHTGNTARELITSSFVSVDGKLVNSIEVYNESGATLPVDNRNVMFAKSLHSVLKRNPTFLQNERAMVGETPQRVSVGDIRALRNIFSQNGLSVFNPHPRSVDVMSYLQEYVMDRAISGFTKADGSALDSGNREQLRILFDANIITPTFEMHRISGVLDAITEMILPYGGEHTTWLRDFTKALSQTNVAKMKEYMRNLADSNFISDSMRSGFEKVLEETARKFGYEIPKGSSSDDITTIVFKDLLTRYNNIIKQYIRRPDGNGFLKPQDQQGDAVITPELLFSLVHSLEAVESSDIIRSHSDLMMDIMKARRSLRDQDRISFLNEVEAAIVGVGGKGNVPRAIQIMLKSGLWNRKQRRFDWTGTADDIKKRMKEVASSLSWEMQVLPSERVISNTFRDSKDDLSPAFRSERPVIKTLQRYVDRYNLGYSSNPGMSLTEVFKADIESLNDLNTFYTMVRSKARIEKDSDYIAHSEWSINEQEDFTRTTSHLFHQIRQQRKVNRIIVVKDDVFYQDGVISENGHYDFLKNYIGVDEVVIIDMKKRDSQGFFDGRTNATVRDEIIQAVSKNPANIEYSFKEDVTGFGVVPKLSSTYYTIIFGSQESGYGIPVQNADMILNQFARWVGNRKSIYGSENVELFKSFDKKISDISEVSSVDLESVINKMGVGSYIELPDYGIVKVNKLSTKGEKWQIEIEDMHDKVHTVGVEDISGQLSILSLKRSTAKYTSNHLQYMLTMMYGEQNILGRDWFKELSETMGGKDEVRVAKLLRRIPLDGNASALRLTTEYIRAAAQLMDRNDSGVPFERKSFLVDGLNRVADDGSFRSHIINEEGVELFSTANQLRQSVMSEMSLEDRDKSLWRYWERGGDLDNEGRMKGGRGDDTTTNSVVYISNEMIEMLKTLLGIPHSADVGNIKPILWDNGILIGKTMFTASHSWHDYLATNKIDMVIFGTAAKNVGSDIAGRVITPVADTIEQFRSMKNDNKVIKIPIEAVKIISTVAPEHDAAIPYQLGTEITSLAAADDLYNWLFKDGVIRFETKASQFYRDVSPERTTAWAQRLLRDYSDDNNSMTSAAHTWIKSGGHPFASWLVGTIRNNFKRRFMDEAGLFVPRTKMGGNSALIPAEYAPGSPRYLRNSIFTMLEGERIQVTYGQASLPNWASLRGLDKDNLMVIHFRPGRRDVVVRWDNEIHGDLKSVATIGGAHDLLKDKFPENVNIAIVVSRMPSKSISDKVIVGIKDFDMTGNAARVNAADLLYRLEGDFDVDKINYWWNTPKSVLDIWNGNAPKIASVEPGRYIYDGEKEGFDDPNRQPRSISGLDWTNPESQWKYNESIAKARLQMGKEVNMRRIVQYLKYYDGYYRSDIYSDKLKKDKKGGFSLRIGQRGRVVINWDDIDGIERTLSRDIQEIIDSTTGYDTNVHNKEWENRILFGLDRDPEYPGLLKFETRDPKTKEWTGVSGNLQKDALLIDLINTLVRPYKNVLRLSADIYDFGQTKRARYDDMISYVGEYQRISKNFNSYLYGSLLKKGWDKLKLDDIFMNPNKTRRIDVVGMDGASLSGGNFTKMLPYDRVMFKLSSKDRMVVAAPSPSKDVDYKTLSDFEKYYDEFFMGENEQDALSSIINLLKKEVGLFGQMNRIQKRIDRLENTQRSSRRRGNVGTANSIQGNIDSLRRLLDGVSEAIVSDAEVAPKIQTLVRQQVEKQIIETGWYDGKKIPGNRRSWVDKNRFQIEQDLWDRKNNGVSAIRFKTIADNEYLSSMIYHRILKNVVPMIDAESFPNNAVISTFDIQVDVFKKKYRGSFADFFRGKRRGKLDEWTDLDRISNIFMQELNNHVTRYDEIMPGLGRVFLWKVMIPEAEPLTYTWFNGRISEGFTDTSPIFFKLGMRYLDRYLIEGKALIQEIGQQFTAHYDLFHSNFDKTRDGFKLVSDDNSLLSLEIDALKGQSAPFVLDLRKPSENTEASEAYSGALKDNFGIESSYTMDYLSYYATAPERMGITLRDALLVRHRPGFADGYDGNLSSIQTHSLRWDKRYKKIGLFVGDALARRITRMKVIPGVGKQFGGGENLKSSQTRKSLKENLNRHLDCG